MRRPLPFVLAAALPILLYARTIGFDYVRADDFDLIAGNQTFLRNLGNVPRAFQRSYFETEHEITDLKTYYRPVTIVSFMLDAMRAGADPGAYHATNVVLHALVTTLILALARAWGAPVGRDFRPGAALGAALVFASHPVNVQAVTWIAGRNDLLLAVLGLLAMLAWARMQTPNSHLPSPKHRAVVRRSRRIALGVGDLGVGSYGLGVGSWYLGVHVFTFAGALFSKETGVLFPALAVLHQHVSLRARLTRWQTIALGLDGIVVLVWLFIRAQALDGSPTASVPATVRVAIANAPHILVHAGKLLVPFRLNVSPGVDTSGITLGVVAVVILAGVAFVWIPRGMAIVGACWALAFLLPTLVVPGLPAYEHRNYLPLIGVLLAACFFRLKPEATADSRGRRGAEPQRATRNQRGLGVSASLRLVESGFSRKAASPTLCLVIALFAMIAYARQDAFRDPFSYWTDATRDAQFAPIAHVNLGQLHDTAGNSQQARREYLRALELEPDAPKAHNNLGVVLMKLAEPDLAVRHFRDEVTRHPWNAEAWFNLGLWEELKGNAAGARRHYERAITENRYYLPAYEKLGKSPQLPTANSQIPK